MDLDYFYSVAERPTPEAPKVYPSKASNIIDYAIHEADESHHGLNRIRRRPERRSEWTPHEHLPEAKRRKTREKLEPVTAATDDEIVDAFWTLLQQAIAAGAGDKSMKNGFVERTPHEIMTAPGRLKLRNYQIHAINRIFEIIMRGGKGALLAFGMGLGKTLVVIALIVLFGRDPIKLKLDWPWTPESFGPRLQGKFLLVVPLALIPLWESELGERINPQLSTIIYHGGREYNHSTDRSPFDLCAVDVVITTYETLRKDFEEQEAAKDDNRLGRYPLLVVSWMAVFYDEAHKLCNEETGVSRAAMALQARFRLPLTGTPFQNEYTDCGTIMRLLQIAPWNNSQTFRQYYLLPLKKKLSGRPQLKKELNAMISLSFRAFTVRLNRHDLFDGEVILKEIMPAIEEYHKHDLNGEQTKFQSCIRSQWDPDSGPSEAPFEPLLSAIQMARLACVHELCASAGYGEHGKMDHASVENQAILAKSDLLDMHPAKLTTEQSKSLRQSRSVFRSRLDQKKWASPRISLVVEIIEEHISQPLAEVGKIVVFSEFLCTLDVLGVALEESFHDRVKVLRFDATVSSSERLHVMQAFNNDDAAKILLVTTRSGGVGLSFTAAGRVIHLTQSWNPAMMWQANDRACRHPQRLQVYIDHMYAYDSIERRVVGTQEQKQMKSSTLLDPDEEMLGYIERVKSWTRSDIARNMQQARFAAS